MSEESQSAGVSFDCFGTLVSVETPEDPARAVATELRARCVPVPEDWRDAYVTPQFDAPRYAEVSLPAHVRAVLEDSDVDSTALETSVVERAVGAAFDREVRTREGAVEAVRACARRGPVGVLSNCSVPGLVERTLERSSIDPGAFDTVVTSVDCGWRKPDRRAFEAVASGLGVPISDLIHVGDDPESDGGATDVGARALLLEDVSLDQVPAFITETGGN